MVYAWKSRSGCDGRNDRRRTPYPPTCVADVAVELTPATQWRCGVAAVADVGDVRLLILEEGWVGW